MPLKKADAERRFAEAEAGDKRDTAIDYKALDAVQPAQAMIQAPR